MLDWKKIYQDVLQEVRKDRMLANVVEMNIRNTSMSFSGFGETARWLADALQAQGLRAEDASYPADGRTKIGGRVMPLAWDVTDAELHLVEPDGAEDLLVSYQRTPYSVVMFSAATDGYAVAPLVHFEPAQARGYLGWKDEDFEGFPIRGSCVFFEVRPDGLLLEKLIQRGAAAFITDGNGPRTAHHQRQPDAVRWINDAFGEGMISKYRKTIPGFSLSPRQGARLRDRLQAGESLRAKFRIQSRTYDGEFHFTRGTLPGSERMQEIVFLLAHLFEPNPTNNCSGVAILIEALAALRRLTHSGRLPTAARTIGMFSSWEMFGIAAYATRTLTVKENGVAGLGVDCLVRSDGPLGRELITLDCAPDSAPSFIHGGLGVMLDYFCKQSGLAWEERFGFTGNENMLSDPTLGPPTALMSGNYHFKDGTYHTSADTIDKLDADRMAHAAALAATAAYTIAAASRDEALWFAEKEYARARRRIGALADSEIEGVYDCPGERLSLLAEIERASVASVTTLSGDPAVRERVTHLCRLLDGFSDLEKERATAALRDREVPPRDETLWHEAASMIPTRSIPGPICLQDVSDDVKREFRNEFGKSIYSMEWYGGTPGLFWVDGQRNVAQICKLTQLGRPALYDDKALASMMLLFKFLERHDYIKVKEA